METQPTQAGLDAYWMPYTSNREFKQNPRMITGADGAYYIDDRGRRIFDGLSGLWTCGAGHNRPEISQAIAQQLSQVDYVPAFQFGHPKAFELAERIAALAPADLNRVFFTNSGSESVDTATKIARAYWRQSGQPNKTRIIGRTKGYHGASWGGISFGGIGANRKLWGQGVEADHIGHTWRAEEAFTQGCPLDGADRADELLDRIALHDASNIAAVIVEPFSGSAGVIIPPVGYLKRLREICTANNILLILDEVITGFGRTGEMFGANAFGVVPDMICCAKQITNGVIPMGAVIAKDEIYRAFMEAGGAEHNIELPHGYTYSGHPVACAASLATLDVLERDHLIPRVAEMSPIFESAIHSLKGVPNILDIRNYGFAAGISVAHKDGDPGIRPYQIAMDLWQKGFYVRYGGDTLQLALPFITERHEIDSLVNAIGESFSRID
ncbi:aminotransferase class III-fold pyridoxal phosphate-dependent enzyme [Vibrio sp. WJH972]